MLNGDFTFLGTRCVYLVASRARLSCSAFRRACCSRCCSGLVLGFRRCLCVCLRALRAAYSACVFFSACVHTSRPPFLLRGSCLFGVFVGIQIVATP
jgi:hypothetical protein